MSLTRCADSQIKEELAAHGTSEAKEVLFEERELASVDQLGNKSEKKIEPRRSSPKLKEKRKSKQIKKFWSDVEHAAFLKALDKYGKPRPTAKHKMLATAYAYFKGKALDWCPDLSTEEAVEY